ncbi:hypothetical protein AB3R30_19870 [Leptolyngbyaceae cyanobacterium UHCC 1019]
MADPRLIGKERAAQKNAVRLEREMRPEKPREVGRYSGLYEPNAPYGRRYSVWLGTESLVDGEFISPDAISEGDVAVFEGENGQYLFDAL